MHLHIVRAVVAISFLSLLAGDAMAWHKRGHMAVALIAFREIKDADQRDRLVKILAEHPHYHELLVADKPSDAPLDEWVIMSAAAWPDMVREDPKYKDFNKPTHHYVNLPVVRWGGVDSTLRKEMEANIADTKSKGLLLTELPERLKELADDGTDDGDRAIALCWVLHLIGDIHQPLHAAALYTKYSPDGDRGGNASFVPWHGRVQNLHSVWDGIFGWDEFKRLTASEYGVVDHMARQFVRTYSVTKEQLDVIKVDDWASQSRELAEKEAYGYQGGIIRFTFSFDQHHHLNVDDLNRLPKGYVNHARAIAEGRVVLAGKRLSLCLINALRRSHRPT